MSATQEATPTDSDMSDSDGIYTIWPQTGQEATPTDPEMTDYLADWPQTGLTGGDEQALDAVFKPEFVQAIKAFQGGVTTGVGPLARAMGALAKMGLLTVFCDNAEQALHEQPSGTNAFHIDVTSACANGNVQLNCDV